MDWINEKGIDLRKDKEDDRYCFVLSNNVEIEFTSEIKFLFDGYKWMSLSSIDSIVDYFDKISAIGIFKENKLETFIPKQSIIMFTKIVKIVKHIDEYYGDDEQ